LGRLARHPSQPVGHIYKTQKYRFFGKIILRLEVFSRLTLQTVNAMNIADIFKPFLFKK
jgi:hypothetical protein